MVQIHSIEIDCGTSEYGLDFYNAIRAVFASLPPPSLLLNFSKRSYTKWYNFWFKDTDVSNQGALVYKNALTQKWNGKKVNQFVLVTPSSNRIVTVTVTDSAISHIWVQFPIVHDNALGSLGAAHDIFCFLLRLFEDKHDYKFLQQNCKIKGMIPTTDGFMFVYPKFGDFTLENGRPMLSKKFLENVFADRAETDTQQSIAEYEISEFSE